MGFFSAVFGFFGFGVGISVGLVAGYYLFIYFQPSDVKNIVYWMILTIQRRLWFPGTQFGYCDYLGLKEKMLSGWHSDTLQRMMPEIPLWVKNPDFDRVDWLNKFIETMWPYLDKAICKTAMEIAKPIIAENVAKYKLESVEFEALTLGTLPPTFQGMKVYTTDEKEIIMEPSLKWAGNPNVTVAVKAFGLKATVQPHVDFGLKLLGADAMAIPDGKFGELIKDQVANMYLWPKRLEVQIMDPTKASRKPVGILHVKVVRASKLKKKDLMGKSDPYVKIKLVGDALSKKTTVKHSNLSPEWNEDFNLVVKDPESQALEITVYDWEQVCLFISNCSSNV
ncbi:hypothetical protein ACLOJK_025710 [Asimina triloba]